jgi:hypothetical protein
MAKTKVETLKARIVKAVAAQKFEEAAMLADQVKELEKAAKVKKKGVKAKPATPAKAPKRSGIASKTPKTTRRTPKVAEPIPEEPEGHIAPSRPQGKDKAGQTFTGEDGKVHTFSRRVSMQGMKFPNKFKPTEYAVALSPRHEKVDKKLRKARIAPRPGQSGASRDEAKKVKVRCKGNCGQEYMVYPWEAAGTDSETRFICNDCIH